MYNSAATIQGTLDSIGAQTYRELAIVVVDDGSTDHSPEIVARHAVRDPRFRLIRQGNSGVAAARNRGAAALDAAFLSFIDADDLWVPTKVAEQLAIFQREGERIGVVYSWFNVIDEGSRVVSEFRPDHTGWVLPDLCRRNFVGNGSSIMIRRAVFDRIGGFDPALRAATAQGSEDLLVCLRAAEITQFDVVSKPLVGYRMTNRNMSSDVVQMRRSLELVLGEYRQRFPEYEEHCATNLAGTTFWLIGRALQSRRPRRAARLYRRLRAEDPAFARKNLRTFAAMYLRALLIPRWFKRRVRQLTAKPFLDQFA